MGRSNRQQRRGVQAGRRGLAVTPEVLKGGESPGIRATELMTPSIASSRGAAGPAPAPGHLEKRGLGGDSTHPGLHCVEDPRARGSALVAGSHLAVTLVTLASPWVCDCLETAQHQGWLGFAVGILSRISRGAQGAWAARGGTGAPAENTDPTTESQCYPRRAVWLQARGCPFRSQFAHLGNGENSSHLAGRGD